MMHLAEVVFADGVRLALCVFSSGLLGASGLCS